MVLISDAVALFVKSLAELQIAEELNPSDTACQSNQAWLQGRRITEFMKAVRYLYEIDFYRIYEEFLSTSRSNESFR